MTASASSTPGPTTTTTTLQRNRLYAPALAPPPLQENEHLYHALLRPVTGYICDVLPVEMRETSGLELYFEDLDTLPADEVARIAEWLTEKVDALSSRLKVEPKDQEVSWG